MVINLILQKEYGAIEGRFIYKFLIMKLVFYLLEKKEISMMEDQLIFQSKKKLAHKLKKL